MPELLRIIGRGVLLVRLRTTWAVQTGRLVGPIQQQRRHPLALVLVIDWAPAEFPPNFTSLASDCSRNRSELRTTPRIEAAAITAIGYSGGIATSERPFWPFAVVECT